MDVEEELDKVHKSMPMGSMYFRRVRTIDKSSTDPHFGKKLWFMIGFTHSAASSANDGYGAQILFQYSGDFIMIRRIIGNDRYWIRFDGTRMD